MPTIFRGVHTSYWESVKGVFVVRLIVIRFTHIDSVRAYIRHTPYVYRKDKRALENTWKLHRLYPRSPRILTAAAALVYIWNLTVCDALLGNQLPKF